MGRKSTSVSHGVRRSAKMASLGSDSDRLLFMMLLLVVDSYGRMEGDALTVRAEAWPALDKTVKATEKSLQALASAGLVTLYDLDGKRFLEVSGWEKHAGSNMRKRGSPAIAGPEVRSGTEKNGPVRPPSASSSSSSSSSRGESEGGGEAVESRPKRGALDFAGELAERGLSADLEPDLKAWWREKKGSRSVQALRAALGKLAKMPEEWRRDRLIHSLEGNYPSVYPPSELDLQRRASEAERPRVGGQRGEDSMWSDANLRKYLNGGGEG